MLELSNIQWIRLMIIATFGGADEPFRKGLNQLPGLVLGVKLKEAPPARNAPDRPFPYVSLSAARPPTPLNFLRARKVNIMIIRDEVNSHGQCADHVESIGSTSVSVASRCPVD